MSHYAIHARANGQEVHFTIPGHTPELAVANAVLRARDTWGENVDFSLLSPLQELSDPAEEQGAAAIV